jgi:hypothetical protein
MNRIPSGCVYISLVRRGRLYLIVGNALLPSATVVEVDSVEVTHGQ